MAIVTSVFNGLVSSKKYVKKVLPYIKDEYFDDYSERELFKMIKTYIKKYRDIPTISVLKTELVEKKGISESVFTSIDELIDEVFAQKAPNSLDWLVDQTEKWCRERSLFNAITSMHDMITKGESYDGIPELMRGALAVCFDKSVGVEFGDEADASKRWDQYNEKTFRIATDIAPIDYALGGGFELGTLNAILGGTGVGKTASLVSLTANMIKNGHDVLYVSLEMGENNILQRYEANWFDVEINDVPMLKKDKFLSNIVGMKSKGLGRLLVKQYPAATVNAEHIRRLLSEVELKKEFKPKIVVIDYLNLMVSSRYRNERHDLIIKSIAEELRGLAVESNVLILTGTQGNREVNGSSFADIDLTNTSESMGLPHTLDNYFGIVSPEDLRKEGIQLWKLLKTRNSSLTNYKFPLNMEYAKSRLTEIEGEDVPRILNTYDNEVAVEDEKNRQRTKKLSSKVEDVLTDLDELTEGDY